MRAIGFKAATGEEAAVTQISWERGCFALCHLHSDLIFALRQNYKVALYCLTSSVTE